MILKCDENYTFIVCGNCSRLTRLPLNPPFDFLYCPILGKCVSEITFACAFYTNEPLNKDGNICPQST